MLRSQLLTLVNSPPTHACRRHSSGRQLYCSVSLISSKMQCTGHTTRATPHKSSVGCTTHIDASRPRLVHFPSRRLVCRHAGQKTQEGSAAATEGRKNPDLYASSADTPLQQPLSWRSSPDQEGAIEGSTGGNISEAAVSVMVQPGSSSSDRSRSLVKPEVLSPAGGWPQMRAAVENGADAVYFGLSDFNARAR